MSVPLQGKVGTTKVETNEQCLRHCANKRGRRNSQGFSLLETVAATVITALVLVGTLTAIRRGMEISRRLEYAQIVQTTAVSKMEENLAIAAAEFTTGSESGTLSGNGYGNIRYSVVRTDASVSGGIEDELMVITSTAWDDADGDTVQDADEISASFSTKVAKMVIYVESATGS